MQIRLMELGPVRMRILLGSWPFHGTFPLETHFTHCAKAWPGTGLRTRRARILAMNPLAIG